MKRTRALRLLNHLLLLIPLMNDNLLYEYPISLTGC